MIPKQFKCAGNVIDVEIEDESTELFGEFACASDSIHLYKNIRYPEKDLTVSVHDRKIVNTFYHELIHVWQHYAGLEYDEQQAQVFGNFLQEFMETKNN